MAHRHSPSRTSSALRVAQYIFTRSACEPTTLWLDGALFGDDLPDGRLLLLSLRELLLRPTTTAATRDAVWRVLIARARTHESWLVAAMGMAMPGLRRAVRQLSVGMGGDRDDLESAVAEGFVIALHAVDLGDASLCARLVTAGRKAGAKQLYKDAAVDSAVWSEFASRAPRQLIGATRLERVPVAELAAELGVLTNTLVQRRRRAEERVRDAIRAGLVASRCDMSACELPSSAPLVPPPVSCESV